MQDSYFLKTGTAGGTLTILFANIHTDDLVKTVVLAAVGATVSLVVSFVLKKMFGRKK
ncbi:hypothetical protein IQ13_1358 [Lacibacter cauensis]|uniref:Uncharacterized protein n=1 Tax=Lacibacter cauensis TaxID=510947 RepID=A0A562SR48_9BACT|nr:hypothetical protein [Lacibacter cauensis]TWI83250.1 hypothetical protein IQ13_1358 [Lacibacter cauensis]